MLLETKHSHYLEGRLKMRISYLLTDMKNDIDFLETLLYSYPSRLHAVKSANSRHIDSCLSSSNNGKKEFFVTFKLFLKSNLSHTYSQRTFLSSVTLAYKNFHNLYGLVSMNLSFDRLSLGKKFNIFPI